MSQLGLQITPRLSYAAENFLAHAGVREIIESFEALLTGPAGFFAIYIQGNHRSGKTHLSIALSAISLRVGKYPKLVEGSASLNWVSTLGEARDGGSQLVIVDDADLSLSRLTPGQSGEFVTFFEGNRAHGIPIVLLGTAMTGSFPCDEHIMSRLRMAQGLTLGAPSEEEVPQLLKAMMTQRGYTLPERYVSFLERRLPRTPGALERYLERLEHLTQVTGRRIGFSTLEDAMADEAL